MYWENDKFIIKYQNKDLPILITKVQQKVVQDYNL